MVASQTVVVVVVAANPFDSVNSTSPVAEIVHTPDFVAASSLPWRLRQIDIAELAHLVLDLKFDVVDLTKAKFH